MKKNIKKLVAVIIAVITIVNILSVTAFAGGGTYYNDANTGFTPTVATSITGASGEVDSSNPYAEMCVVVSWDNIDFTYKATTAWDPEGLKYIENGGWDHNTAYVTVTNKSNCAVKIELSIESKLEDDDVYGGVSFTMDKYSAEISSAVEQATAPSETFTLTISGTPNTLTSVSKKNACTVTVAIEGIDNSGTTTGGSQDGDDNDT